MDTLKDIWAAYKGPILGGAAGLVLAVLFLEFGFWKTLLVVILTGVGIGGGLYLQDSGFFSKDTK